MRFHLSIFFSLFALSGTSKNSLPSPACDLVYFELFSSPFLPSPICWFVSFSPSIKLLDQQINKVVRLTASSSILQAGRGQAGAKQIRNGSTQHRWLERKAHEGVGGESGGGHSGQNLTCSGDGGVEGAWQPSARGPNCGTTTNCSLEPGTQPF